MESPPPANSNPAPQPGALIDVRFPHPLGHSATQTFLVIVLAMILSAICAVAASTLLPSFTPAARMAPSLALAVAMFAILFGVGVALRARNKRPGQAIAVSVARDGIGPALATFCGAVRGWSAADGCDSALRTLLSAGHQGLTLRIGKSEEARTIEPLIWPIEPQPLDEAYSSLLVDPSGAADATRAAGRMTSLGHSDLARVVRRNVRRKGGWWPTLIFVPLWAFNVGEALLRQRVTLGAVFWTALLFGALFLGPVRGQVAEQWFIVPGGMVRRKAGAFQKRWNLHLFERTRSVLFAVRWYGQSRQVFVTDGVESARKFATRDEVDLLLRAWLSPLPPPPVERLSDLE